MQEIKEIFSMIISNEWLKIATILAVFIIFMGIVNILLNAVKNKTKNAFLKKTITFFKRPLIITITMVGIVLYLKQSGLSVSIYDIISKLLNSILFIYYLFLFSKLNKIIFLPLVEKNLKKRQVSRDIIILVDKIVGILVIVVGIYLILSVWKVNLTPLLASAGIAGIAFAMAAKDSLSNLFGGMSLFLDKAFKVGDYIVIDGDKRGEVVDTGFRSTKIKTRDDILVTIPNSILANATLINESSPKKHSRIKIPVGVAYGTDLDLTEKILLGIVEGVEGIEKDPERRVRVRGFGTSSVDMELMVWIKDPSLRGIIKHQLFKKIYKEFTNNNVIIPFPQMDVHVNKLDL